MDEPKYYILFAFDNWSAGDPIIIRIPTVKEAYRLALDMTRSLSAAGAIVSGSYTRGWDIEQSGRRLYLALCEA